MKMDFRKLTASLVAVTTLAVSMVGISANAVEVSPRYSGPTGYIYFGPNGKAGTYVDSRQINLSTSDNSASNVTVKLTDTAYESLTGDRPGVTYSSTTYVSLNCQGYGIIYAAGLHTVRENGTTYSTNTHRNA